MRQMKNPSNQMALPGLDPKGEQRMKDARQWVAMHPDEWRAYKDMARQECSRTHASTACESVSASNCQTTSRRTSHASPWRKTRAFA